MTVWTHSQGVFPLRAELVKVAENAGRRDPLRACGGLRLLRP